jgi:DNA-binding MarR family transcriptional regulator
MRHAKGHGMDDELIDLLRTVSTSFQGRLQQLAAANGAGLTAFQARLINLVGRNDGISQLTLGARTDRDKGQIARAVKELEAGGFVIRSPNSSDWRSKSLTLTDSGRDVYARLRAGRRHLASEALAELSVEEKQALQSSLQKMIAALQTTPDS